MDPGWNAFAALCRREFVTCEFQAELVQACAGSEDIAWVVYSHRLGDALAWMRRSIPALGGKVPASLIAAQRGDEVRHCLWSMPR